MQFGLQVCKETETMLAFVKEAYGFIPSYLLW